MISVLLFFGWYSLCLPEMLFRDPYSTVLESREGELLSASIAPDGQWRFPPLDSVPPKFEACLLAFEDKRFYNHPGVDVLSVASALRQNISSGKIVRGASTVTMQVIRLSRKGKDRNLFEKIYESVLATRLELRHSKAEILAMYASHAPFGGNVVGVEAACWRYFGRNEKSLSWAEAAFLAVLPNAPSLVHPGRNREVLLRKRNALLESLRHSGAIDSFTCVLAKEESLPSAPQPLPRLGRHLLARAAMEGRAGRVVTSSVSYALQTRVEEIMGNHAQRLLGNEIHNGSAIVADVRTGEVLAYVGNSSMSFAESSEVDVVRSPRSTGSILKPILFAATLDEGKILPTTLLPDIPTFINGFAPQNFSHDYDGAVPANQALIRSLNIPAVFLLKEYRYEKFHALLRNAGLTTITKPADHYGLSLILGGAEGTLWDIAGTYASMARTLSNYFEHPGKNRYRRSDFHPLDYVRQPVRKNPSFPEPTTWLSASSIYQTFEVLRELYRPGEESGWKHFESSRRIAWKTGTSFGFRDAWAVGVTPEFVVAVWVGNADGEGRPGLTGVDAAAPIMFDIFSGLGPTSWFQRPDMEMADALICRASGMRKGNLCPSADTVRLCARGLATASCTYHRKLFLTADGKHQVNSNCADLGRASEAAWFLLPPVQEHFFKRKNLSYRAAPPFKPGCLPGPFISPMELVYPKRGARLFIPRNLAGEPGNAIFELAHRHPSSAVFWYLDGHYLGLTRDTHRLALNPPAGKHILLLIDEAGHSQEETFEVLSTL